MGHLSKEVYLSGEYEAILQFDKFHKILANKAHKPYYIPDRQELLNYNEALAIEFARAFMPIYS